MRLLFILLAFIPTFLSAQTDSWVKFAVQYDYWGDQESAFTFVSDANGDTVLYHQPTQPWEYLDTIVDCNSGPYTITLNDAYGDGWASYQSGQLMSPYPEFKMSNDCQGMIFYADSTALVGFSVLDTLVNINPCAPPVQGCLDTNALNFDPLATISDGSCTYPACSGILSSNAYQQCLPGGQALVIFEWTKDDYNPSCETVKVWYTNEEGVGPYQYGIPSNATNFAVNAGNGQMPPTWSVEHYLQVEFVDGTMSDTITYIPTPCIEGCTDPTQISYNPWATEDDGSCSGTTCDTSNQYQITMDITFDNWPSETSWIMNSLGVIDEATPGTYDFNDIGQTYTYNFCIDQNAGFELIVNDSYGDGMAGSTSGGSMDGAIVIYDCSGDTIWYMDNPGFGNVLYSGPQTGSPCPVTPTIDGCTDDDYVEFNPAANNDDGSCLTLHVYGCTDSAAFNYDASATIMDLVPDCNYELWIGDAGGDGWGNSYLGIYQNGIDLGTFTMGPGSYQQTFGLILDPGVPVEVFYFEVGGPQQPPQEVQFQTWHNSFKLTNANGVELMYHGQNPFANNGQGALQGFSSPFFTKYVAVPFCGTTCIPTVLGCMDSTAFNYNPSANTPDNCVSVVLGCTNPIAFNYDPLANVDDSSCVAEVIGCMDSTAFNFNPAANTNDPASCVPVIYGCMDDTMFNYNPAANTDDNSCIPIIYGCTDINAFNYDSTANTNNNSCVPFTYGCTDPNAFNFDPLANTDDSTCIDIVYGCMDPTMFNYDPLANVDNGVCEPFIYGCMDSTMFNFNPLANADNNSCIPFIYGCTDPSMLNYDPQANTEDFSCISYIYGCTDSTALNYDPLANTDNGTCIETVAGCTEVGAYNYDPTANVSDSSCLYDAGCITGPGNPYWLNDGCYAWVIDVDNYCCTNAWDPTCQSMYDYCQLGWPTAIEETGSGSTITVYPNPTEGILNIDTRLDVSIEVYDINGKLMIQENSKRIDFSSWPTGIYNLIIRKDKLAISKRIIKQ